MKHYNFKLDEVEDKLEIKWLDSCRRRERSRNIREALKVYLSNKTQPIQPKNLVKLKIEAYQPKNHEETIEQEMDLETLANEKLKKLDEMF